MATTYTLAQKKAIYKWVNGNREQYNATKLVYNLGYYEAHSDTLRKKRKDYYYYLKEAARLNGIAVSPSK